MLLKLNVKRAPILHNVAQPELIYLSQVLIISLSLRPFPAFIQFYLEPDTVN